MNGGPIQQADLKAFQQIKRQEPRPIMADAQNMRISVPQGPGDNPDDIFVEI